MPSRSAISQSPVIYGCFAAMVPLWWGVTSGAYGEAFRRVVVPVLDRFGADLVVDVAVDDPVAVTLYSNPFTIVPLYYCAFKIGQLVLMRTNGADLPSVALALEGRGIREWIPAAFEWLASVGKPLLVEGRRHELRRVGRNRVGTRGHVAVGGHCTCTDRLVVAWRLTDARVAAAADQGHSPLRAVLQHRAAGVEVAHAAVVRIGVRVREELQGCLGEPEEPRLGVHAPVGEEELRPRPVPHLDAAGGLRGVGADRDGAASAAATASTPCPKVWNWYLAGTYSVCPPISGTTGIIPALIASTVDMPNGSPGNG